MFLGDLWFRTLEYDKESFWAFSLSLKTNYGKRKSYIKDSGDLINQIKDWQNMPEGAILFTVDMVGLCTSIPHEAHLNALRKSLNNRQNKLIITGNLLKMVEFVLKLLF